MPRRDDESWLEAPHQLPAPVRTSSLSIRAFQLLVAGSTVGLLSVGSPHRVPHDIGVGALIMAALGLVLWIGDGIAIAVGHHRARQAPAGPAASVVGTPALRLVPAPKPAKPAKQRRRHGLDDLDGQLPAAKPVPIRPKPQPTLPLATAPKPAKPPRRHLTVHLHLPRRHPRHIAASVVAASAPDGQVHPVIVAGRTTTLVLTGPGFDVDYARSLVAALRAISTAPGVTTATITACPSGAAGTVWQLEYACPPTEALRHLSHLQHDLAATWLADQTTVSSVLARSTTTTTQMDGGYVVGGQPTSPVLVSSAMGGTDLGAAAAAAVLLARSGVPVVVTTSRPGYWVVGSVATTVADDDDAVARLAAASAALRESLVPSQLTTATPDPATGRRIVDAVVIPAEVAS
ncbi:MAG: hypothetical protein ACYCS4_11090 [Acidimicrobiales bacterium]